MTINFSLIKILHKKSIAYSKFVSYLKVTGQNILIFPVLTMILKTSTDL